MSFTQDSPYVLPSAAYNPQAEYRRQKRATKLNRALRPQDGERIGQQAQGTILQRRLKRAVSPTALQLPLSLDITFKRPAVPNIYHAVEIHADARKHKSTATHQNETGEELNCRDPEYCIPARTYGDELDINPRKVREGMLLYDMMWSPEVEPDHYNCSQVEDSSMVRSLRGVVSTGCVGHDKIIGYLTHINPQAEESAKDEIRDNATSYMGNAEPDISSSGDSEASTMELKEKELRMPDHVLASFEEGVSTHDFAVVAEHKSWT
jgi:hypothetical protein